MEKRWDEGGTPRVIPRRGGIVRVSTESERMVRFRATTHAERAISQSFVQNRFEQSRVIQHQTGKVL